MASLTSIFSLGQIERYLFRPLFVFFTFCLVLLAIFQASGRFTMASLALFEEDINMLLNSQNINVAGLRGSWRGLNPVVTAERIEFPAGEVSRLEAELDVLESMFRSAPIARLVAAEQLELHTERTADGWRLRGMPAQAQQFDFMDSLRHSDELRGRVRVHLYNLVQPNGMVQDTLEAEVLVTNRGGVHHADLALRNVSDGGELIARAWQRDSLWPITDEALAFVLQGGVRIPQALVGMPGLSLNVDGSRYIDEAGFGAGEVKIAVAGVALPATEELLAGQLDLMLERSEDQWRGRVDNLRLQVADDELALGALYLQGEVPQESDPALAAAVELIGVVEPQPQLSLWLAELDLSGLADYFSRHLGGWEPAGRWVRALALQGMAHNLHAFYDPDQGLGYMASLNDIQMQGYKGVPTVANVQGQLWGHDRAVAMQVRATDSYLGFPDQYHEVWPLDAAQGVIKAWFGGGYFGLQGTHLRGSMGETDVAGAFAVTRPGERYEQRLSLQLKADQVSVQVGKTFVPYRVPDALREWLDTGPRGGTLSNAQFALHGQVHLRPGELGRRIELTGDIADGRVVYAPDWPEVADLHGSVHVAGVDTRVAVTSAVTQQVRISDANIVLRDNSSYVTGELNAVADAGAALDFVRGSPLRENLNFVTPAWQGSGHLQLQGDMTIPINTEVAPPLAVDLTYQTDGVSLAMPEFRMVIHELAGTGSFSLPHHLDGDFTAALFGEPSNIRAHFNEDWLFFDIDGRATPDDVYRILQTEDQVPITGAFNFDSILSIAMAGGVTNLFVESDLQGLAVNLPGEFAKTADAVESGDINVQFLADYQSVSWRYQEARGWLHYGEGIERGALGIRTAPPMTAQTERAIVIAGQMPSVVLSEWVSSDGDSAVTLPLDWMIQGLKVDRFVIDDMSFADVSLTGAQRDEAVSFAFDAPTVRGKLELPASGPMRIALDYLELPSTDEVIETHIGAPQIDPLAVEVGRSLPAAKVVINELQIGKDPFGAWRFNIEPAQDQVLFSEFSADVNGVHFEDATLHWDLAQSVSSFSGRVTLDDLAETLPKWNYAPSLSTQKATVVADVNWPGSPLNVSLVDTTGRVDFAARDGRFIEVDNSGNGLRILGLLNFTKVAKRISLDFSDVVGDGLSFEKIDATVDLNAGELNFARRMKVESSSGDFRVGGSVDLRSGQLDNEMIVTLPVSKSLPWYGVYLALANPLAGLGVVVGERMLRKPIEQFSTAKFEVKGTLDAPEVKFVSLWDQSLKGTQGTPSEATPEAEPAPPAEELSSENVVGAVTVDD